ncbi:MAG: Gfo/Idh/MocA family oxidoreductase [Planctomycetes bacterium]|nr:Gfo/Idh/MocA family oxidoreductase [Planctomycetota bacterium]
MQHSDVEITRRSFILSTPVALAAAGSLASVAHAAGRAELRVGVIGCGGRGGGAAVDALHASPDVRIVALADLFQDRLDECRANLLQTDPQRAKVENDKCFTGFDAYEKLLATDVDYVILATAPHFRPIHFEAAIAKGKHVFIEKPVGVDPTGIRRVLAAADEANKKKLCVVAGTQRRHEKCYLEAMQRIRDGAIGDIVSARCYWNMGTLWEKERKPEWTDVEWQIRNWLYFTWLSGDHIVEQHVHNIDVINWAMGSTPVKAMGMGGRQVRVAPRFGNIFDHFAVDFEYQGGVPLMSMCRQTDGCADRVSEAIHGTKGICYTASGFARIDGKNPWEFKDTNNQPYVQEHVDLIAAIRSGKHVNEAHTVARSTLCAIMGRMSAYTGKEISWDFVMNSKLDLAPAKYTFGDMKSPDVAVPGRTPLI